MSETDSTPSPTWSPGVKLVVGLTFVAIVAALLIRFNNIIGPLILAFILSYVFHPLASALHRRTRLSWRGAVNLIYLVLIILIISLVTVSGVAIVQQLQSLVGLVQDFIVDLPNLAENLAANDFVIQIPGVNWQIDLSQIVSQLNIDLLAASEQILTVLQPALGQAGSILGTLAASALVSLGWGAFVLVVSYFILADSGQVPKRLRSIELPGHSADIARLGRELGRIWNAFLRGQLVLLTLIVISSFLLMSLLGVRNALGLAFLAGLAKFIPYVGPLVAGIVTALVAFFQPANIWGFEPLTYAIVVVVSAVVLDQIYDNLVTPRIYGRALGVHPAAVLVAAIIAASLIGFVGLLLAAPVLASFQLLGHYAARKMLDLDPWPESEAGQASMGLPMQKEISRLKNWLHDRLRRGK